MAEDRLALAILGRPVDAGPPLPWGARPYPQGVGGLHLLLAAAPPRALSPAEALAVHDRLAELARHHDLLPLRLGPAAPLAEVTRPLAERLPDFRAHLDRMAGTVEVELRVQAPLPPLPPAAPSGGPGAVFLAARRRHHGEALRLDRAEDHLDHVLDRVLPADVLEVRADPGRVHDGQALLRRALRVPRDQVDDVVRHLQRALPAAGLPARLTGPWPLWSFASPSSAGPPTVQRGPNGPPSPENPTHGWNPDPADPRPHVRGSMVGPPEVGSAGRVPGSRLERKQ